MQRFLNYSLALFVAAFLCSASAGAQNSSSTLLTATPSTVNQGESSALTASVQVGVGDPTPTGTMQFIVEGNVLATVTLDQGIAVYVASSNGIKPGTYPFIASYSGDSNTAASQSSPTPVTVSHYATQTGVSVTPSRVLGGQTSSVTATATVTAESGNRPLTGTVSFLFGTTIVGTAGLSNGQATFTGNPGVEPDGTYQVTAVYNGDTYNGRSTSQPAQVTVAGRTTTALSISPQLVQIGSNASVSVTVSGDSGIPATGTVSFYYGTAYISQAVVSNGSASVQASTAGYQPGAFIITAKYSGDANNGPSSATASIDLQGTTTAFNITPAGAAIATGTATQFGITPSPASAVTWYVNGVAGGSSTTGTIDSNGNYSAPAGSNPLSVQITASEASNPYGFAAAVPVYVVVPGSVAKSNNSQVAAYYISAPQGGQMSVEFGLDTTYGTSTWQQPTPSGGGTVRMLVAGMTAPATYHMRADVAFGNGIVYYDADQTFATTLAVKPVVPTVTLGQGMTPQPGIEMVNPAGGTLYAYDLAGNFIWGMPFPQGAASPSFFQPIKLLPSGNLLVQVSPESAFPVDGTVIPSGTVISVYEMQLDGTVVNELTLAQLNTNLTASGYVDGLGNQITLYDMHHDVILNPVTGHWLVLSNTTRLITGDPGTSGPTTILGDVILDVDPSNNFAVDWVWNAFDNLDVNRHPQSITDWTHSNALVYSASDHNLLISMRHQNWVLKLDYNDGAGTGDILWHFGYQGDFTLVNGTSPQDWQYAQHGPSFTTSNTSGVFGLTLMDNGLNRIFPPGYDCADGTSMPCHYSRVPQFTVDDTAMTATLDVVMPYENYSFFGGNAEILANGDSHGDFCAVVNPNNTSEDMGVMEEYTGGDSPQFVWSMSMGGAVNAYRGQRWGSFYPGVTWTQ
jgi:arylsulfate sulfotransferase